MMTTSSGVTTIRQRLRDRAEELRADIVRELKKYDVETYSQLADRVSDSGEQSVADLLSDIDLAEISRDVEEFREIEAALLRIARGTYGICIDCDEEIDGDRLSANPTASRCLRCQAAAENRDREQHHRTL